MKSLPKKVASTILESECADRSQDCSAVAELCTNIAMQQTLAQQCQKTCGFCVGERLNTKGSIKTSYM